ncbi:hypothetical protein [Pseudomonas sp. NPDC089401]|uniref:hypothetical protein n=1 Tax=Pseudomonas sp. NPDC089401 TaxID=3364462 RepID=UPI0038033911
MRQALLLALAGLLLGGCANHKPQDYAGTWINQDAIDATVKSGKVLETLSAQGAVSEIQIDNQGQQATYLHDSFEHVSGRLSPADDTLRFVDSSGKEQLKLKGDELHFTTYDGNQLVFVKPKAAEPAGTVQPLGSTFRKALYQAYLGGSWKITEGQGVGATVHFNDNSSVTGLPGPAYYALCMGGDCRNMAGDNDSMWLERDQRGAPFIFKRDGDTLTIFKAVNTAQPDEIPQLVAGARQWVLERD